MMAAKVKLDIVTPEKTVYREKINVLEAPAIDGLIGILPRHAPMVTALKTGVLRIRIDNDQTFISISKGFMEVKPTQINVVVATAELPEEIDVGRAEAALERAEKRLESEDKDVDTPRAKFALERALARLKAAGKR